MAFSQVQTAYVGGAGPYSTTVVAFDPQEELIWTANTGGYISSYHGGELVKYSAYASVNTPLVGLAALPAGIFSVGNDMARLHSRQGLGQYRIRHESFENLVCLTASTNGSIAWVSGTQPSIASIDVATGVVTNVGTGTGDYVVLCNHGDRMICAGTNSGKVHLHDPNSLNTIHSMEPYGSTVNDIAIAGNTLVTCGWSHRSIERHLMVYDLRMLKSMAPYQLPLAPSAVCFVPAYANNVMALDQTGQFLICNLTSSMPSGDNLMHHEVDLEAPSEFYTASVSSTSHCLAFGDTNGVLHLWTDSEDATFNTFSEACVMADERPELPALSFDDLTEPLSSVPMPWVNSTPLSDMPKEMYNYTPRQNPSIDKNILSSMKLSDFVGYAPNPRNRLRNQIPYKTAKTSRDTRYAQILATQKSPMNRGENEFLKEIPKLYRPVKLRYSRIGLVDFDFKQYNHTSFSGLEINIPNAYCNAMLQMLYFLEPLKVAMQSHHCDKSTCLACELGFLFNMLDVGKAEPCQASNFLRILRSVPEAQVMGLLFKKDFGDGVQLSSLIQRFSRFLLQQLVHDTEPKPHEALHYPPLPNKPRSPTVSKLFTSVISTLTTCKECGYEETKQQSPLQWSMTYPRHRLDDLDPSSASRPAARSFTDVLCGSLLREQTTQPFCKTCKKHQPARQVKDLKQMPQVLCINCQADSPMETEFWQQQQEMVLESLQSGQAMHNPHGLLWKSWLPSSLRVTQQAGKLCIEDSSTMDGFHDHRQDLKSGIYYDLVTSVAHIDDSQSAGCLVAHVRVSSNYHRKKEGTDHTQWYVFNDFSVSPVSQDSTVDFGTAWKVPCMLFYARRDLNHHYDLSVRKHHDPSVLAAAMPRANPALMQVAPPVRLIQMDELPQKRTLVGLDAEFVVLNNGEEELHADGKTTTIKPSCMGLARITAVRGGSKMQGAPFIDDHIAATEPVVDYLTKYSGIKPGDLDPGVSTKHLVTLKQAYRKLKYLADCGVVFVGHGLKKDFRVINMLVPADQIRDTVELFHLPNQRYISLRFLAWFFLSTRIQSVVHDSMEDARTAVILYRRYLNLKRNFQLNDAIKRLYVVGREHEWTVPAS